MSSLKQNLSAQPTLKTIETNFLANSFKIIEKITNDLDSLSTVIIALCEDSQKMLNVHMTLKTRQKSKRGETKKKPHSSAIAINTDQIVNNVQAVISYQTPLTKLFERFANRIIATLGIIHYCSHQGYKLNLIQLLETFYSIQQRVDNLLKHIKKLVDNYHAFNQHNGSLVKQRLNETYTSLWYIFSQISHTLYPLQPHRLKQFAKPTPGIIPLMSFIVDSETSPEELEYFTHIIRRIKLYGDTPESTINKLVNIALSKFFNIRAIELIGKFTQDKINLLQKFVYTISNETCFETLENLPKDKLNLHILGQLNSERINKIPKSLSALVLEGDISEECVQAFSQSSIDLISVHSSVSLSVIALLVPRLRYIYESNAYTLPIEYFPLPACISNKKAQDYIIVFSHDNYKKEALANLQVTNLIIELCGQASHYIAQSLPRKDTLLICSHLYKPFNGANISPTISEIWIMDEQSLRMISHLPDTILYVGFRDDMRNDVSIANLFSNPEHSITKITISENLKDSLYQRRQRIKSIALEKKIAGTIKNLTKKQEKRALDLLALKQTQDKRREFFTQNTHHFANLEAYYAKLNLKQTIRKKYLDCLKITQDERQAKISAMALTYEQSIELQQHVRQRMESINLEKRMAATFKELNEKQQQRTLELLSLKQIQDRRREFFIQNVDSLENLKTIYSKLNLEQGIRKKYLDFLKITQDERQAKISAVSLEHKKLTELHQQIKKNLLISINISQLPVIFRMISQDLYKLNTKFYPAKFELFGAGVGDLYHDEDPCDYDIQIKNITLFRLCQLGFYNGAFGHVLYYNSDIQSYILQHCPTLQRKKYSFSLCKKEDYKYDFLHTELTFDGEVLQETTPGALKAVIHKRLITVQAADSYFKTHPISLLRALHRIAGHYFVPGHDLILAEQIKYFSAENFIESMPWDYIESKLTSYAFTTPEQFWITLAQYGLITQLLFRRVITIDFESLRFIDGNLIDIKRQHDCYYMLASFYFLCTMRYPELRTVSLYLEKFAGFIRQKFNAQFDFLLFCKLRDMIKYKDVFWFQAILLNIHELYQAKNITSQQVCVIFETAFLEDGRRIEDYLYEANEFELWTAYSYMTSQLYESILAGK
jgi:hypothetical protein